MKYDEYKVTDMNAQTLMCAGHNEALSKQEQLTVAAICSRVVRVLGLQDRQGLQRDIAIVQANCPIDLDALAAAPANEFLDELLSIVDSADRTTGSLKSSFNSRFMLDASSLKLV